MPAPQDGPEGVGATPPEDRRLAELTEHALHLLDELADARIRAAAGLEWERRCRELEARLAETRQHVRATRSRRLVARAPDASADGSPLDVCLWAPPDVAAEERDRWLAQLAMPLAKCAPTLLCRGQERPREQVLAKFPNLRLVEAEGMTPAQLWNLGVASGNAPLVLFLARGAVPPDALTAQHFAAMLDPDAVLGQVVLTVRNKAPSLGLGEKRGLELRPLPHAERAQAEATQAVELDFVAPEAFVLQRANAAQVGPFDEDLQGTYAIVEYALRCKTRRKLVLGLPQMRVDLAQRPGGGLEPGRDRLLVLARHRPGEVSRALAGDPTAWQRPRPELEALARSVLSGVPSVGPEATKVLVDELIALRGSVVPPHELKALLAPIEKALDEALVETPVEADGGTPAAAEREPGRLDTDPHEALARLLGEIQALGARLRALESAATATAAARHEAERQVQAARTEADAVRADAHAAHADAQSARTEAARSWSEAQAAHKIAEGAQNDAARAVAEAARLRDEAAHFRDEAARLRDEAAVARAQVASAQAVAAELRREAEHLRSELAAANRSFQELMLRADRTALATEKRVEALRTRMDGAEKHAVAIERDLDDERNRGARRVAELAERVGHPKDLQWPSLMDQVSGIRHVLAEREAWIVILLEELAGRRLKLRQRRLTAEEERFLAERRRGR